MKEDTGLRFRLAHRLMKMRYGDSCVVPVDDVMKAWPPTGDYDRSMEGAFHALALASGGHRPESSYTTDERIIRDLDDSFKVRVDEMTGDRVIHRRMSHCPKCRGEGSYYRHEATSASEIDFSSKYDAVSVVENRALYSCDHLPKAAEQAPEPPHIEPEFQAKDRE